MLDAFLSAHCARVPAGLVPLVDFAGAYRVWCIQHGRPAPSRGHIVAALESAGFALGIHDDRQHIVGLTFVEPGYVVRDGKITKALV